MTPDREIQFAAAFCKVLNELMPGWNASGGVVHGPAGALIRFSNRHDVASDGHADIEFSFSGDDPLTPRFWDCVSGFGATVTERVQTAAHLWGATSARALLEFKYSQLGKFADHFHSRDPQGLHGWHCICSPIIGYGQGRTADALQKWWLSRQIVLPKISPCLQGLAGDRPHSIKIFFGAHDIAEVRVDGDIHQEASETLGGLDWPRLDPMGFLRVFVIALHRE